MNNSRDMKLNYTVKGQGNKNIILLHGWGGSLESLTPLQNELGNSDGFRVYNIEWPGFGNSRLSVGTKFMFDDYSEALIDFIISQRLSKPTLVGHSFGGKVAIATLLKKQDIADRLVLINSSGIKPKNTLKRAVLYIPTKAIGAIFTLPGLRRVKPFVRKVYYKLIVREGDYLLSSDLKETLQSVLQVNFDTELSKITTNTLLIWGENDSYTPLWMGRKFANELPNAKIEIVKDAKHNLPLVNPEIVATIIRLYLK